MQVRWNFKLLPNQSQLCTLEDWLVTLRKHRNYALRERIEGFDCNNKDNESSIVYAYGSYCEIESRIEFGSCCPLTSPVVKHGVIPHDLNLAFKNTKIKDFETKEAVKTVVKWDSASGIQMKVTTQLRKSLDNFAKVVFHKNKKTLPADCGKVTLSRHQSLQVETLVPCLWGCW
ncbi:MAG: hypothetical protein DSM106950_08690 [Stigonema ocellatum SAG 48.90 = DSM 106950]|nr:hypothetical protein [Stigonema ocellatum SAG 48.90 = DSM 106950]